MSIQEDLIDLGDDFSASNTGQSAPIPVVRSGLDPNAPAFHLPRQPQQGVRKDSFAELTALMRNKQSRVPSATASMQKTVGEGQKNPKVGKHTFPTSLPAKDLIPRALASSVGPNPMDSQEGALEKRMNAIKMDLEYMGAEDIIGSNEQSKQSDLVDVAPLRGNKWESTPEQSSAQLASHQETPSEVGQLRYQLESTKKRVSQMTDEIRQQQIQLDLKTQDIQMLKSTLEMQKQRKSAGQSQVGQEPYLKLIQARDAEIEQCRQLITRQLAQAENTETKVQQCQQEIQALHNHQIELKAKYDAVQDIAAARYQEIQDLKVELEKKTAFATRLQAGNQLGINEVLRGAAHLVVPSNTDKLPQKVYTCIECFKKNLECDSMNKCHECTKTGGCCARWRCSIRHVTKTCTDFQCRLKHGADGWLVFDQPPPRW